MALMRAGNGGIEANDDSLGDGYFLGWVGFRGSVCPRDGLLGGSFASLAVVGCSFLVIHTSDVVEGHDVALEVACLSRILRFLLGVCLLFEWVEPEREAWSVWDGHRSVERSCTDVTVE